jgi:replicative DNA helicase
MTTLRFDTAAPVRGVDNGVKPVTRIQSRLGREITATANHPLLTITGWRELGELKPGDSIAVPRKLDVFGVDTRPDAEVALLGHLIGDGDIHGPTPLFTNIDPVVLDDVANWANALGLCLRHEGDPNTYRLAATRPITLRDVAQRAEVSESWASKALMDRPGPSDSTRAAVRRAADELGYRGRRNPLTQILIDHGIHGLSARDKFVPEAIFKLPERQLALFLSRLFATDGSAWTSGSMFRIEYSTVSRQLAMDVQHLLLRFGVIAKVTQRRVRHGDATRTAFDVSFRDPQSVAAFANRIGIFSKERAVDSVSMRAATSTASASADLLPMDVWHLIDLQRGDLTWAEVTRRAGRPSNHNWHAHARRPSRSTVAAIAEALGSDELRRISSSEVTFDPIVSMESAGFERTYDIEVPVHHNFVANDIVVHNSALTMNVATNVAMRGLPVAIFSLEMSKEEVAQRMLCSVARIDSMKVRTGNIGEASWPRLTDAAGKLYNAPVYVDDSPVVTVTDIRAKCRRLKRLHGLVMVVVDYMQLMQGNSRENRQQEIAEISRALKNLARELELPIIAVSQLNRNLEQREDKRPRLGDLRESGSLEQDADIVMFIYRDEYYNEQTDRKGIAEVVVAKHRAGSTGTVEMTFMPEYTRFSDLGRD